MVWDDVQKMSKINILREIKILTTYQYIIVNNRNITYDMWETIRLVYGSN